MQSTRREMLDTRENGNEITLLIHLTIRNVKQNMRNVFIG